MQEPTAGKEEAAFQPHGFRQYPTYKESGVDWLTVIPVHWDATRLRFVINTNISKREIEHLDPATEVSFVPMEAVGEYGGIRLDSKKSLSNAIDGYTYFRDGDVLVAKITPCFENGKGALASGLSAGFGFGTTELHVLRASIRMHDRFLLYVTFSDHFRRIGTAAMFGAGGQKRISSKFVRDFCHPIPDLFEQRAIATFLDRETSKINSLIKRKERLIELLQEKRIALISHAVTRGRDPDVPLKDSGVEWLGEIPVHWGISRLKFLAPVQTIKLSTKPSEKDYVGLEHVESWTGRLQLESQPEKVDGAVSSFEAGDVLFGKLRPYLAKAARPDFNGVCSSELLVLRPKPGGLQAYIMYCLLNESFVHSLNSLTYGAKMPRVSPKQVANSVVPVPSESEQRNIATFLDRETEKLDLLISRICHAIDLLREYRIALISAAVTGKIDVREAS